MDLNNKANHVVADFGNSRLKLAHFHERKLLEFQAFSYEESDAIGSWIQRVNPSLIVCISVGRSPDWLRRIVSSDIQILPITHFNPELFPSHYKDQQTLGADRIAAIVACRKKYGSFKNILVITAGSCLTYNWIIDGDFLGGSISPGLRMRMKAMHDYTEKLPEAQPNYEKEFIANETLSALSIGAFKGILFEIQGYIKSFQDQYQEPIQVIVTGGDASILAKAMENTIFADDYLIAEGINEIYLGGNQK